jgi:hypothetical protein
MKKLPPLEVSAYCFPTFQQLMPYHATAYQVYVCLPEIKQKHIRLEMELGVAIGHSSSASKTPMIDNKKTTVGDI